MLSAEARWQTKPPWHHNEPLCTRLQFFNGNILPEILPRTFFGQTLAPGTHFFVLVSVSVRLHTLRIAPCLGRLAQSLALEPTCTRKNELEFLFRAIFEKLKPIQTSTRTGLIQSETNLINLMIRSFIFYEKVLNWWWFFKPSFPFPSFLFVLFCSRWWITSSFFSPLMPLCRAHEAD